MTRPETTNPSMIQLFDRWQRHLETAIFRVYEQVIPFEFHDLCALMHREMGLTAGGRDAVDGKYTKIYGKIYEDKYRLMFRVADEEAVYMFFTEDDIRGFYNRYF
ncbi:hypothetical protein TOTORO_01900 [Serratia phage vB_SmaS-Totoro]|nr:hypothetical protein TOTORO_01900 [Serratia phage vB_SmaS-Totoro]